MKTSVVINLAALACLGVGLSAHAECAFPKAPATIPDGKSASEPEMVEAMKAFKAYNEEVVQFGTCLDDEAKNGGASGAQLMAMKTMKTKKINAAQEELQTKAKLFNEQVRIFKARG
ncbi:MAG: hypothetical protein ACJ8MR_00525 [Povalibacter sp.]